VNCLFSLQVQHCWSGTAKNPYLILLPSVSTVINSKPLHVHSYFQWAVTTSVDFSLAQLIQVIILLSTGGKNGGGYEASKYVVIAMHGGILLLHAALNSLPISLLSFFGQLAAAWNLVGMKNSGYSFSLFS